ncbi:hypothetical protein AMAG_06903 [Allomyces macrogynus ATCC 38327]|uniref:Uncharacterized protein n=1 Tax=Allomyces macrogynus (strain ATCC 38327) TaxID=578462 RepID=A0A0L0SFC9_ALLM3|nr:hypothetical protein AMAG_06903 [Allomyces macrogynus ATCC 38327]|eukprot:KNE61152.1 hypothetical protein AMAG_06903 [Allomyces macrogynus ATCC 38327]
MDSSQQQPPRGPGPGPTPTAVANAGDNDETPNARAPRHVYGYTSHHHVPAGAPEWRGITETAPVAGTSSWPPPPPMHPLSPFERAHMQPLGAAAAAPGGGGGGGGAGAGGAAGAVAAPTPTAAVAIHAPADNNSSMPAWDNTGGNHARYTRADRDRPSFAPSPGWPHATDAAALDAHNSTASRPGSLHAAVPAAATGTDTTPPGSGGPTAGASRRGPVAAAATTPSMTGPVARGHSGFAHAAAARQGPPPLPVAHDLDDPYAPRPAIASRMQPGPGPGPGGAAAGEGGEGRHLSLYGGGNLAPPAPLESTTAFYGTPTDRDVPVIDAASAGHAQFEQQHAAAPSSWEMAGRLQDPPPMYHHAHAPAAGRGWYAAPADYYHHPHLHPHTHAHVHPQPMHATPPADRAATSTVDPYGYRGWDARQAAAYAPPPPPPPPPGPEYYASYGSGGRWVASVRAGLETRRTETMPQLGGMGPEYGPAPTSAYAVYPPPHAHGRLFGGHGAAVGTPSPRTVTHDVPPPPSGPVAATARTTRPAATASSAAPANAARMGTSAAAAPAPPLPPAATTGGGDASDRDSDQDCDDAPSRKRRADRQYNVFDVQSYELMLESLRLATDTGSRDALLDLLRARIPEAAKRKKWKRLMSKLRLMDADRMPNATRTQYIAWWESELIIVPQEEWPIIMREAHQSDLPLDKHRSSRQTQLAVRQRYETRRSRGGLTMEVIDNFCCACPCYRTLVQSVHERAVGVPDDEEAGAEAE